MPPTKSSKAKYDDGEKVKFDSSDEGFETMAPKSLKKSDAAGGKGKTQKKGAGDLFGLNTPTPSTQGSKKRTFTQAQALGGDDSTEEDKPRKIKKPAFDSATAARPKKAIYKSNTTTEITSATTATDTEKDKRITDLETEAANLKAKMKHLEEVQAEDKAQWKSAIEKETNLRWYKEFGYGTVMTREDHEQMFGEHFEQKVSAAVDKLEERKKGGKGDVKMAEPQEATGKDEDEGKFEDDGKPGGKEVDEDGDGDEAEEKVVSDSQGTTTDSGLDG